LPTALVTAKPVNPGFTLQQPQAAYEQPLAAILRSLKSNDSTLSVGTVFSRATKQTLESFRSVGIATNSLCEKSVCTCHVNLLAGVSEGYAA